MRIAVIGQGNIGGTLGAAFARGGHDVIFGSRHPADGGGGDIPVASIAESLDGAEAVLLALPAGALDAFLAEHAGALDERLVVDATNNVGAPVANGAAAIRAAAPGARYVRAFNTLGWENFADPLFDGQPADLFYSAAADDRGAVEELIAAVGLRPAYLGADQEDVVDHALPLWFGLMRQRGNRRLAFRVVEK